MGIQILLMMLVGNAKTMAFTVKRIFFIFFLLSSLLLISSFSLVVRFPLNQNFLAKKTK
jgi:hypothetical protein